MFGEHGRYLDNINHLCFSPTGIVCVRVGPRYSRQKKRWEDNIREWQGMDFTSPNRAAKDRTRWKRIVAKSSVL